MASTPDTSVGRVSPCRLIDLEQHKDERGSLSIVESEWTTGFSVQRVYYLHDLMPGTSRGAHAHRALEQFFVAAHGSFTVSVDDGHQSRSYRLDDPGIGLYVGPLVWRDLKDFSEGAVCLVLASEHYDEEDYYRDYDAFLKDAREHA